MQIAHFRKIKFSSCKIFQLVFIEGDDKGN
jgi:hypothetical protein